MRTLAADGVDDGAAPAAAGRSTSTPAWLVPLAIGAVVAVGVVARFVQRSPLWLDEALSVNIASLPLGDMFEALRHDGHPPFYYLVLHAWMSVFGEGDGAVRALSGIFAVAALPLTWIAGRRIAGPSGARWALAVAALSPYLIRYATETRMYSMVMLLVLAGYLVLTDALDEPRPARLAALTLISGVLLLSHYWSFYLLGAVGLMLAFRWWRSPLQRAATGRVLLAVAGGGVLFLPLLRGVLLPVSNTGPPRGLAALVLALFLALALFAARSGGREITLDVRTVPIVRRELIVIGLVLAIGCVAGFATNATYQSRYAAVFVPLLLLAVAVGITRIPGAARVVAGGAYLVLAIVGVGWVNYYQRTQAEVVGDAVAEHAQPGDVVVYCPDQLGPDYSRAMPDGLGLEELTYPALTRPERVDWVDYAERNEAADPVQIAEEIRDRAGDQAIFLVWMSDYRTLDSQCEELLSALGPANSLVIQENAKFYEPAFLHWVPAPGAAS